MPGDFILAEQINQLIYDSKGYLEQNEDLILQKSEVSTEGDMELYIAFKEFEGIITLAPREDYNGYVVEAVSYEV